MKDPGKSASAKSLWPRIPKFVWFLVAFLTLPWFHYYRSIDGVVVDAETGEPIENVIVVAYWELKEKMFHNSESGVTHISEVVTDSQGRYHLPGKLKLFPKHFQP